MVVTFVFIYGLVVGSFLNVVIARLNTDKSFWQGFSACPRCGHKLAWYDNIPILSYLLLRGKCRYCFQAISPQYLLVELFTAAVFTWLYLVFGLSAEFFVYLVFVSFLIVIFTYDLLHYLILDSVSLPALAFALVANLYIGLEFTNLVLAGLVGAGFFAVQFFVSKGAWVGGGDIRLGALMGLMLGWPVLLAALFLAYLAGSIVGLTLIAVGKKHMSSQVPFGPFLALATLVCLFYGHALVNWYLRLL